MDVGPVRYARSHDVDIAYIHGDGPRDVVYVPRFVSHLDLAGPREVLASRTVRDLVAGSELDFEDRGSHELKGVNEAWQLYAAVE